MCFEAVNAIDASGGEMLRELNERLRQTGVQLVLFDLKKPVYAVIARAGLVREFGKEHVVRTLDNAKPHLERSGVGEP